MGFRGSRVRIPPSRFVTALPASPWTRTNGRLWRPFVISLVSRSRCPTWRENVPFHCLMRFSARPFRLPVYHLDKSAQTPELDLTKADQKEPVNSEEPELDED